MNDAALETWAESIPAIGFRARRVKLGIVLVFAFPLFALYSQGVWAYVAYGLNLALLLFLIYRRLNVSRLEGTDSLDRSDPAFREIVEDVDDLHRRMGSPDHAVVLRIDKAGFSTSPSVQSVPRKGHGEGKTTAYLVLPIGFIALHSKERNACRAVLAHELAHVRQNDWQAWAFLSAGISVWKWFTLPTACLGVILGVAMMMDLHVADRMLAAQAENARDYAEMNRMVAEKNREEDEFMEQMRQQNSLGMNLLRTPEQKTLDDQLLEVRAGALQAFIAPLVQFLLLRIILRSRSKSERAADLAAAAATTPEETLRALELFGTSRPWWALLEAHPPLDERVKRLRAEYKMPSPARSQAGARPVRRIFRVRRGLRGLLWFDAPAASNTRGGILIAAIALAAIIGTVVSALIWSLQLSISFWQESPDTWSIWNAFEILARSWVWLNSAAALAGQLSLAVLLVVLIKRLDREAVAVVVAAAIGSAVEVGIDGALPGNAYEGVLWYWASVFAANVFYYGFLSLGLRWGLSFGRALVVGTLTSAVGWLAVTTLDPRWWTLESAQFTGLTERILIHTIARTGLLAMFFAIFAHWSRARARKVSVATEATA